MVALWTVPGVGTIEEEGIVRLNDGRTFDLSSVPGNGYNATRLGNINDAIRTYLTTIQLLTSLPVDDPDRTINPDRYPYEYWGDADGTANPAGEYLCSRSVDIWLTWDGSSLIPHCRTP